MRRISFLLGGLQDWQSSDKLCGCAECSKEVRLDSFGAALHHLPLNFITSTFLPFQLLTDNALLYGGDVSRHLLR